MRPAALAALALCLAAVSGGSTPDRTAGVPLAPVMIEVFSDFQCPSCRAFHTSTLPALMDDYVTKGKVYLVFREFPLSGHPYARQAAALACAAAQVGKYTEVGNALFARQAEWSNSGKVEDVACSVLSPALAQKVKALAREPGVAAEINRDVQLGQSAGVNGTPTLVVTRGAKHYPISGSLNYNLLRRLIDDLLAK